MSEIKPIGGATGGSRNLSTSLSNVARLGAHPNFSTPTAMGQSLIMTLMYFCVFVISLS
jgi:hypothetical protein